MTTLVMIQAAAVFRASLVVLDRFSLRSIDRSKIMLHLSQAVDSQLRGDFKQAAEELKRAIDAGLDNMAAYFQLGLLRYEANRLESAVRHLQRAVQHPDFSLGSRLLLGDSYLQMGRTQDAAVEYMEALKLQIQPLCPLIRWMVYVNYMTL